MLQLRSNSLGWKLEKSIGSYGFIIRKSGSFTKTILSMGPFWLNLIIVAFYIIPGEKLKVVGAVAALPFTFLLAYYVFKDVEVYINTKRRIIMDGWFCDRFSFDDLSFRIQKNNDLFQLLLINNTNCKEHVGWESVSMNEIKGIEDFLKDALQYSERKDGFLPSQE